MTPTKLLIGQILVVLAIIVASIWTATQWAAARLAHQPELGAPWFTAFHQPIYRPWSIFPWWFSFDAYAPIVFDEAGLIAAAGGFIGCGAAIFGSVWRARQSNNLTTYGSARWATLVIAAAPAVAEPVSGLEPTTVNVDYSDLDLSSDAGVATLGVRVRSAIKLACPEMIRDIRQQAVARKCRTAAAARANEATEIVIASARAAARASLPAPSVRTLRCRTNLVVRTGDRILARRPGIAFRSSRREGWGQSLLCTPVGVSPRQSIRRATFWSIWSMLWMSARGGNAVLSRPNGDATAYETITIPRWIDLSAAACSQPSVPLGTSWAFPFLWGLEPLCCKNFWALSGSFIYKREKLPLESSILW